MRLIMSNLPAHAGRLLIYTYSKKNIQIIANPFLSIIFALIGSITNHVSKPAECDELLEKKH